MQNKKLSTVDNKKIRWICKSYIILIFPDAQNLVSIDKNVTTPLFEITANNNDDDDNSIETAATFPTVENSTTPNNLADSAEQETSSPTTQSPKTMPCQNNVRLWDHYKYFRGTQEKCVSECTKDLKCRAITLVNNTHCFFFAGPKFFYSNERFGWTTCYYESLLPASLRQQGIQWPEKI
jgi:hypothetical protein